MKDHQVIVTIDCLECIDEDGVLELVFVVHFLEDGVKLAISGVVLLENQAFCVKHSWMSHTALPGLVLEDQCVIFDTFSGLACEVYDSSHWLYHQTCQSLCCAFHKSKSSLLSCVLDRLHPHASNAFLKPIKNSLPSFL